MSKSIEKFKRALLFTTLPILYTLPAYLHIRHTSYSYKNVIIWAVGILGSISMVYATLCVSYKGFVTLSSKSLEMLSAPNLRYCSICKQPKPERTFHCSRCRNCVKKMDHHCFWFSRCVNYDNLGHFARFLLFTTASTSILSGFYLYHLVHLLFSNRLLLSFKAGICIVIVLSISALIAAVTGLHFCFQIRMILNNITIIEMERKKNTKFYDINLYESPYDMGVVKNLSDVFGPPMFLFLGMPRGDGMHFKHKWDTEASVESTHYIVDSVYDDV